MTASPQDPADGEQEPAGTADPPSGQGSSGGVSVGVLTGGAVAAGERASAEDRSQRTGAAAPVPPPGGYVPPPVPGAGIAIGVMSGGAAASGTDASAVDSSSQWVEASPELLAAVGTLRGHLGLLAPTAETAEVDAQLAATEGEIAATGRVRRDRLRWLRERLSLGATAVAALASAAAVVQAIVQLLG